MSNGLLYDEAEGPLTGKSVAALKHSRDLRSAIVALFGGEKRLPTSVMKAGKIHPKEEDDEHGAKRSYGGTAPYKGRLDHLPKWAQGKFITSGKGAVAGTLSMFPQDIGRTMLVLYSAPGDTVVDPFAGHNSRLSLCVENGRHYKACDLCAEFMQFNRKKAAQLRKKYPKLGIELHECDSRKMPIESEVGDFTITSPPYYAQEKYGDEPEQLGKCPSYEDFLDNLLLVLRENHRCLKPGAYACWFVNDFRKGGRFFSYHTDTILLARQAGFEHHDIAIVDFGRAFRDVFLQQTIDQRILPKRHEYCLVFRKPLDNGDGR